MIWQERWRGCVGSGAVPRCAYHWLCDRYEKNVSMEKIGGSLFSDLGIKMMGHN
jgi:hypothetical protein